MSKQTAQQPTIMPKTNQTPFERFTAAASTIFAVPKSSLPKSFPPKHKKKSVKK